MSHTLSDRPVSSEQFYDVLAPAYPDFALTHQSYTDTVDELIIGRMIPRMPQTYLDVGCGNGRRTAKIAASLDIGSVLGIDESSGMLSQAQGISTEHVSILDVEIHDQFDMITTLWNVLGHISNRKEALLHMQQALAPSGSLFLDVHNCFNRRAYGDAIADANRQKLGNRKVGVDVLATHSVDGKPVTTVGHVFHPDEVDVLAESVPGLIIVDKVFVNYSTGHIVNTAEEGQIFYELVKQF